MIHESPADGQSLKPPEEDPARHPDPLTFSGTLTGCLRDPADRSRQRDQSFRQTSLPGFSRLAVES